MKRLLTMAIVLAMMATMFVVSPVAFAADIAMTLTTIPTESGIDDFTASFTGVEDAVWVVWTVYATNNDNTDIDTTSDDEIIFIDQKKGNKAAAEGFRFTFASNTETDLIDKTPFVAEAKIIFSDSANNTTKTEEFIYLPYVDVQDIIRKILNKEVGILEATTELGVPVPTYYINNPDFDDEVVESLLDATKYTANYAVKKDITYDHEDISTNIATGGFYTDLNDAILFNAINSGNVDAISNLLVNNSADLGILATDNEKIWYNASNDKTAIDTKLAGYTYETVTDFVNQFKALAFLDKITTENQIDVVDFIRNNHDNYYIYDSTHLETPVPFVLDFTTFDSYTTSNPENLAKAQFEFCGEFDTLEDLKVKFNELIDEFDNPIINTPDPDPGYNPPAGVGPTITVTPSKPIVGEDAPKFTDIDSVVWAHEAINALAKEGVIAGVTNTQFQPNANVTREQFVQIIVKTFGLKGTGVKAPFVDVYQGAWFEESLNIAYELGIVSGISDNEFGIGATITRQDMATIMYRVANYLGINLVAKSNRILSDEASINGYAVEAVNALYKAGIINGVSEGVFAGSQIATRAQAAKLCYDLREAK